MKTKVHVLWAAVALVAVFFATVVALAMTGNGALAKELLDGVGTFLGIMIALVVGALIFG